MKRPLKKIADLYTDNLRNLGASPRGVGWRDKQSQMLRFAKLGQVLKEETKGKKINFNDLGCGYGAMYLFLKKLPQIKTGKYFGYDISESMLAEARKTINAPGVFFVKSDRILHQADYSFASGIFNVKFNESNHAWKKYTLDVLKNMNNMSRKGFAFNALSTYVDYKEKHLYYADALFYFDFCKKHFSKRVSLLHDYKLYEWTMIVKEDL
ncbi:class I SAM-dependent methyltransferase [Candidatus Pacearchaeota archaeon]|nr:class I SAM-dependent methyltransferase [Candidatus Pacearchaeota archaeon]